MAQTLNCPSCGSRLDEHLGVPSGEKMIPQTGDLGICFYCGCKITVDGAGQMILLTSEMENMLSGSERRFLQRVWEGWSEKYSIRGS